MNKDENRIPKESEAKQPADDKAEEEILDEVLSEVAGGGRSTRKFKLPGDD
ncbi:MAG: hypothetical protein LUD16_05155 [Lachnospiraceae bacterium]|nr:hypothetical protein [Lachnospiraceae bacterium]